MPPDPDPDPAPAPAPPADDSEGGGEAGGAASGRDLDDTGIAVTVDLAVLTVHDGRFEVLLLERRREPFRGAWALPGGFIALDEDLDRAVVRELRQETGIAVDTAHLEQLHTYGAPGRDPRRRVVTVAYVAFVPDAAEPRVGPDTTDARFWPVSALGPGGGRGPKLAFDHATIVRDAVERTRRRLETTTLATSFLPEHFTIPDLRRLYEAVWGQPLHPGNFRRKVLATPGFVSAVPRRTAPSAGRPAQVFRAARGSRSSQPSRLVPPLVRPPDGRSRRRSSGGQPQ